MEIGCYSTSLAVKDIKSSRAFYEKLGFHVHAGEESHNFLIMKNGDTNIGLFQGMFEDNILTFNPGWDQSSGALESYTDIREIQAHLSARGITSEPISAETGPASFTVVDPDGNSILFDQHV